ncbi:MAG: sec-independent protein translocase protein TatA [Frankiaceae bacterium]|jgi:sec-independent protein translocase protein TatA|nr:sec-independent protein translocase protein TatA [Frankiaceae bacterium]MDX6225245.1 sec-independent protein translocase protein TatA [Frankiales bacterium]MDX6273108.1 sec-independent protein translocase protein TatA [Frankiales bacterium]
MFGLDAPELIVIAVVVVLLFGAKRLPDAARSMGRSMRIFRSEVRGMSEDEKAAKAKELNAPADPGPSTPSPMPGETGITGETPR